MATPSTSMFTPGPWNVFVPEATSQLQVEFSRRPETFAITDIMQIVPNQPTSGYFASLDSWEAVRIVTANDHLWPDGQESPVGVRRPLEWLQWRALRKAFPFTLGKQTVDSAKWDVVASHSRMAATLAMTSRANDAAVVYGTAANWPTGSKAATVDALLSTTGANWYAGATAAGQFIKKSFLLILESILKNTAGVVGVGDVMCVMNPTTARQMAASPEVVAYLTQHEQAMSNLSDSRLLSAYGLPPMLYGVRMVVEDAVKVTTRRDEDDSATTAFVLADNDAVFLSRPGGLVGNAGPNFSTVVGFFNEEMTVETKVEDWDRMTKGRVTENYDIVLAAPLSGYHMDDVST